ncbi:outer membrane protein assembly factor BamD [bacterium]|nr:outer membrane protein assembly factor BamD [Akkermansiaceae bacterium]MDB4587894.1 outer membrane protein assembly factor BamD [bacterium]MDB4725226.1 outer membrane protein assembly factor BamD [Akkermansiaceae bacterium]
MSLRQLPLLLIAVGFLTSCTKNIDNAQLASTVKAGQGPAKALYDKGRAAEAAGKSSKAIKIYRNLARDYPLSSSAPEAKFRQASLLDRSGKLLEAFDEYNDLLAKYPASTHYTEAIKRQEAVAHAAAGGSLKTPTLIGLKTRVEAKKATEMLAKVRDNAPRSPSAERAQFTIGEVWENKESYPKADAAYRQVVRDYPESKYAPEAQFRIGQILVTEAKKGNQDSANLERARQAFDDLLLRYPNSKRADDARREIKGLSSGEIQRTYDVAEFYRKKGKTLSALFYYRETVRKSKPGALHNKAKAWIAKLGG